MAIEYALHELSFPTCTGYRAQVLTGQGVDLDQVIERMVTRGSTVVKADILSVLEDFCSVVEDLLVEGASVITPVAIFRLAIRGVFDSPAAGFDPSRHQVVACVAPGKRLRRAIPSRARVLKLESSKALPNPLELVDVTTGEANSTVTPGGLGRLVGRRLRYDPADPDQGIFFLAGDGGATRVEQAGRLMPSEVVFSIPALPAGDYRLEVRACFNGTEELRSGVLQSVLTVG